MLKRIKVRKKLWEKISSKSYDYGFNSLTILKCIGIQLYKMWFPDYISDKVASNWIEQCRIVEDDYSHEKTIRKGEFSFRLLLTEIGVDIVLESTTLSPKMLESMKEAVQQMIEFLLANSWEEVIGDFLPLSQKKVRQRRNDTESEMKFKCLHQEFYENALENPNKIALIGFEDGIKRSVTYKELKEQSLKVAEMLINCGVEKDDLVAVSLPRGIEQVIAVLGIHSAGGAYVPIGIQQPTVRKKKILDTAEIKFLISNKAERNNLSEIEDLKIIEIEKRADFKMLSAPILMPVNSTAYIIFTSGTTGAPKGVIISHQAAYNTIFDINQKFGVTEKDCGIGLSELDFDLSVYDIFGMLSVGGTLLVVNEEDKKEARIWNKLIVENNVTVWNTVPAFFDMLLIASEYKDSSLPLKKIFLSGDWIKIDLFKRAEKITEDCRFISLGGATEASIWSNYYEVSDIKALGNSIPYGLPLSNQRLRVVDQQGHDCPDYVAGELWIGGSGVAKGYLNQEELTKEKFSEEDGVLWYKTGDMARYNEKGIIEFLGRKDTQVKINGFRIELGEIESVLRKYKGIDEAVVTVREDINNRYLAAVVVPDLYSKEVKAKAPQILVESEKSFEDDSLYQRKEVVERFLLRLFLLNNSKIANINDICCEKMKKVLMVWMKWLEEQQVVKLDGDRVLAGERYNEVLDNKEIERTEIGKRLFSRIELFQDILQGKEEVINLLEYEELLPEALALQGLGTQHYLEKIIQKIRERSQIVEIPISIAILGGGTGLAAEKIIKSLGRKVNVTLFDTSSGMINRARERLAEYQKQITFQVIEEGYLGQEHLYAYDFVVAVNSLHQYKDPAQGVRIAAILLKNKGRLLAIEYEELDPVAIVVSTLLEGGFSEFNLGRSNKNSPLLTKEDWRKVFIDSNFADTQIRFVTGLAVEYIEAESKVKENINRGKQFSDYLQKSLPKYMIPERIEVLGWLPLSKNGKVDRKKVIKMMDFNSSNEEKKENYLGLEEEIAEIWKELLQSKNIGRNQSFFEIGGDSLLATRFLAYIQQRYNVELTLRNMFENAKLSQLAELIKDKIKDVALMVEGEI